ncbi:MAG: PKD domain-containing protein [Nanoarchaeota archaeon]|nr:PKD domain-containing protein [Nanoarchaeota archaeon]
MSNAIKTIIVNETDLVALKLEAIDADSDALSYRFTKPLDMNGEWQTKYGDAGEYKTTVIVSDGKSNTSEDVVIVVKKKNAAPSFDSFSPEETDITIDEGDSIDFNAKASDLNNDPIKYIWYLDGAEVSDKGDYNYKADYGDAGVHSVRIVVSDGEESEERAWVVKVNKVDRERLLEGIKDVEADEGDVVSLDIPDFKRYNLEYSISEPIGNENSWQTGYSDSGTYDVEVKIEDRKFSVSKKVNVVVRDKDRAPEFKPIASVWVSENKRVTIELEASDPDGDDISFSADELPKGASLDGNRFEWDIGYDAVNKDDLLNGVLDKFHILYKPVKISFTAKSKEVEEKQTVWIMVKDVNRAPVFKDIPEIYVDEGEEVVLTPESEDPDGDNVKYSYEGWMDVDRKMTNYGDAGVYKVKITASDGFLSDEKYVIVNVNKVNRAPVFGEVGKIEIKENEKIELNLNVNDPDGDAVEISAKELPANSKVEGNIFTWVPGYDTVKGDYGIFALVFESSDGESESTKDVNITVYNVNRAPKITEAGPAKDVVTKVSNRTVFAVKAEDPDGDELSYIWKFGLFESHIDGDAVARTFTIPGDKPVKVVVSDGKDEADYEWNVKVIGTAAKPKAAVKKTAAKPAVQQPVQKPVVQKPIQTVAPKPVQPVVKPQVVQQQPKTRTGSIYDQYTITYIEGDGGDVIGEDKNSIIVWGD